MPTESARQLQLLFKRCAINWAQSLIPHPSLQNAINARSMQVCSESWWLKMVLECDTLLKEMLKKKVNDLSEKCNG